jgi:MFS family permease
MYVIVFLQGLVFYGPVSTVYRQAKGMSMTEIFAIESVSWIIMLLLEVPWGWFADRYGYKKTIIISNFLFFISKIVFFIASSFSVFLLERIFLSAALSGLSGCDITLLYLSGNDNSSSERIFARYGWFSAAGLLSASLLSPLIIGISLEATALFTIIPYGLAAAASLLLVRVKPESMSKPSIRGSFRFIAGNKRFILFVVAAALTAEAVQSVTVFLYQLQYVRSGIGVRYFGFLLALVQAVRLIGVKSHVLSSRLGGFQAVGVLSAVVISGCVLLALTTSPVLSVIFVCLIGGSMALAGPIIIDIQNSMVDTGNRATILSAYSMCGGAIAAAADPLIGIGSDRSVQSGFLVCGALSALSCALLLLYMKKSRRHETETP